MKSLYDRQFYEGVRSSARASALEIVPLLIDAVQPASVIDVGCGDGTWLKVFAEYGVEDYLGVDGANVDSDVLCVPQERFLVKDLSRPLEIGRRFDCATSFEVAEHLDDKAGRQLVKALVSLAPVVAFSAAIPRQGGAGHVNERWQDYWGALFLESNYVPVDCVRPRIWHKQHVAAWYAQNMIVYVDRDELPRYATLARIRECTKDNPLSIVHPRMYEGALSLDNWTVRGVLGAAAIVVAKALRWRMQRLRRKTEG